MKKTLSNISVRSAQVGIAAKNLSSGKSYFLNEHKLFGTASVIKICIALTLFKKVENGKIDINKLVFLQKDEIFDSGLGDCGVLKYFEKDSGISLYNACLLMLALSDNTATNLILRFVKRKDVNDFLARYGFLKTRLTVDKLSLDLLKKPKNFVGMTTPLELIKILEGIIKKSFISAKHSSTILQMMSVQQINHKIPRLLPSTKNYSNKYAEIDTIASKTGELSIAGITNDVAVITTTHGKKIIMVIFTKGIEDSRKGLKAACIDHASTRFIAQRALDIYNYLT